MSKIDFTFCRSNEVLRSSIREVVDATSYQIGQADMPLSPERVDAFFRDWPQYSQFPYIDELKENKDCLHSDAINGLAEFTATVDGTFFLF
jgi:hypothetical protein